MKPFIYTTCFGSFVISNNKIVDKLLFKPDEAILYSEQLKNGGTIAPEKELMKKHKCEVKKDIKVSELFQDQLDQYYIYNLVIAKNQIKKSLKKDIFIIQAVNHLTELDKVFNMLAKRLREWYGYYNPEFSDSVQSHEKFAELIIEKDRKTLLKTLGLTEDESMGCDAGKEDIEPMRELARQALEILKLRQKQEVYLESLMKKICPNVLAIAGTTIGAKLLATAGSLERMAGFPSSTIQVLGAEKALFRHLKTGARPPRYGHLINHPLVTKTDKKNKGKVSRALADKLSIAAKVDYFKGEFVGDKLREQLEKRFGKNK